MGASRTMGAPAFHPAMRHPVAPGQPVVGLDLGLSAFVVAARADRSELERITAPKALRAAMPRLQRADRAIARKQRGSARRHKALAARAETHARVAAIRRHFLHETSTHLAKTHGRLCVEDLAVANMVGNHHLARAITDASWGEFSRQLAYKAEWYGCELVVAPRFFASSKTCSKCGTKRDDLSLAVRVFSCEQCGLVADRDTNAAANLAAWGECELGARETRLRTPKCGAGTPMPAEDRALAITLRDGETQSATPAPVGQKREPVRTDSSA